jgi:hypothetical protein
MADEIPPEIALELRLRRLEQQTQKLVGAFDYLGAELAAYGLLIHAALHQLVSTASDPTAALRELAGEVTDALDSLSREQATPAEQTRHARIRTTIDGVMSDVTAWLANDAARDRNG